MAQMTRKTRFMSLAFLMLSLAFFFVPDFREALGVGLGPMRYSQSNWFDEAATLSPSTLQRLTEVAIADSDALTLGFVALQHPDAKEQERLAEMAIDLDSELTWLLYALHPISREDAIAQDWFQRLQEWEPGNAAIFAIEGTWHLVKIDSPVRNSKDPAVLQTLSQATEWRAAMSRAYSSPNFDNYHDRLFNLLRAVMLRHHLENPAILVAHMAYAPMPNLLNSRAYAIFVVFKLGKDAERAGRRQEALRHYRSVLDYGQRMRSGTSILIGKLIGQAVMKISAEEFDPLLRRMNRADEADSLKLRMAEFRRYPLYSPLGKTSNALWNSVLMILLASLVVIFGAFSLLSVGYVNAKRWIRPDVRGKLFELLTVSENYAPVLFFGSSLALYFVYYPYAVNFRHYLTVTEDIGDFEPLFHNLLPTLALSQRYWNPISPGNPFAPYIFYALFGLLIAVGAMFLERKRLLK